MPDPRTSVNPSNKGDSNRRPDEAQLQAMLSWAMPRVIEHENDKAREALLAQTDDKSASETTEGSRVAGEIPSAFSEDSRIVKYKWGAITPPNQTQGTNKFHGSGYDMLALIGGSIALILEHKVVIPKEVIKASMVSEQAFEKSKYTGAWFKSTPGQLELLENINSELTPSYITYECPFCISRSLSFSPTYKTAVTKLSSVNALSISDRKVAFKKTAKDKYEFVSEKLPSRTIYEILMEGLSGQGGGAAESPFTEEKIDALSALFQAGEYADNLTLVLMASGNAKTYNCSQALKIIDLYRGVLPKLKNELKIQMRRVSVAMLENPDGLDESERQTLIGQFEAALEIHNDADLLAAVMTIGREGGDDKLSKATEKAELIYADLRVSLNKDVPKNPTGLPSVLDSGFPALNFETIPHASAGSAVDATIEKIFKGRARENSENVPGIEQGQTDVQLQEVKKLGGPKKTI